MSILEEELEKMRIQRIKEKYFPQSSKGLQLTSWPKDMKRIIPKSTQNNKGKE